MEKEIKVILAEDHTLFRNLLKKELEAFNIITIGEAANGNVLFQLLENCKPDLILMDIEMPLMDGNKATALIKQKFPEIKIMIISQYDDFNLINAFAKLGAEGYIPKHYVGESLAELNNAIRKIVAGEKYFIYFNSKEYIHYSDREREIIPLICKGLSNKEIAATLRLSEKTVEKHKQNIFVKSDTRNSLAFVRYSVKKGFEFLGSD